MTKISTASSAMAEPGRSAYLLRAEMDRLSMYESTSSGREFDAIIPSISNRRSSLARRNELLLKTWRGVPTERGQKASTMIREGLSNVRDFDTQRVIDCERMFFVVLGTMTLLLAAITIYFVMNFQF